MTEPVGMSFMQHLGEFRARLIKSVLFLLGGMVICYAFSKQLFRYLRVPFDDAYQNVYGVTPQLQNITMIEGFMVYLKVAFLGGLFLAIPFIFYQILGFVLPALRPGEKKLLFPCIAMASLFFIGGALFGYGFVFPKSFEFLLSMTKGELIAQNITMQDYFKFASMLLIGFGVAFEFPLVVFVLVALGVMTPKQLLASWKGILVLIMVLSALLTPADVSSMLLMAVPLFLTYFMVCGLCFLIFPSKTKTKTTEA